MNYAQSGLMVENSFSALYQMLQLIFEFYRFSNPEVSKFPINHLSSQRNKKVLVRKPSRTFQHNSRAVSKIPVFLRDFPG